MAATDSPFAFARRAKAVAFPCFKLVSVLCLIPALCSWAFLQFQASNLTLNTLIVVDEIDASSFGKYGGVYMSTTSGTFVPMVSKEAPIDLFEVAASVQGIRIPGRTVSSSTASITLTKNGWCLSVGQTHLACSPDMFGDYTDKKNGLVFRVAPWREYAAASTLKEETSTTSWLPSWFAAADSSSASFGRNPNKRSSGFMNNKHLADVLKHPATYTVVALNVILAFLYWNSGTEAMTVAKYYPYMIHEPFEIWRSLTGATAHFEGWHLAVNMMSLFSLGQELEGRVYSSLAFCSYNLVLIPITTAFWMGLHWCLHQQRQPGQQLQAQAYSPTVGYSGVLFAWMVVASLRQTRTCPIFFLPTLCFPTYQIFGLSWSWSPLVQLAVMQVLLPRVSWTGHAAGVVAGFLVTYGILPASVMEQPAVTLPLLYVTYLVSIRKAIVIPQQSSIWTTWRSLVSTSWTSLRLVMFPTLTLVASVVTFGVGHALTGSYFVVLLVILLQPREGHVDAIMRLRFLTVVFCLVSDGMTAGAFLFGQRELVLCFLWLLRSISLFWILIPTAQELPNSDNGIFGRTIGWTVPLAKKLSRIAETSARRGEHDSGSEELVDARLLAGDVEDAFPGRGQRLGGG